ncbi:MAG: ferritin-like domain-containing protein [Geminicoccaceae bacterium]
MSVNTIQELFVEELRDIYHAEKQLVKALPKMARAATTPQLRDAIANHLEETKGQVERLDQVFEMLELGKRAKRCEAMEGLIEEGRTMIDEVKDPEVLDAGLIIGAQKVEHYEIAAYGSLVALAAQLGHRDAAEILKQTLEEEKTADRKLNELALTCVNQQAGSGGTATQAGGRGRRTAAA